MIDKKYLTRLGSISKSRNYNGEIEILFIEDILGNLNDSSLFISLEGLLIPYKLEYYKLKNDTTYIIKLFELNTKNKATTLVGKNIFFEENKLSKPLQHRKRTVVHFIGYKIYNQENRFIGIIKNVIMQPMNVILELENHILLPYHNDILINTNVYEQFIILNLPDGLLELN